MATIDDRFNQATSEWKKHCHDNGHFSMRGPYLDCDAYRKIVSMGKQILPLIRKQLNHEYETERKYDEELKRLKIKVFGTDKVVLYDKPYFKICKDKEYQKYQKRYDGNVMGNPGELWLYVIKRIVPDFKLRIGKEGSGASIVKLAPGFVGINREGVMKDTLQWLDKNMAKYVSSTSKG